ncbi:efflux RND transporter periplasmic adaptor subunit [Allorhizobium sp. BGMRC 0089]|uniref:efflux RND transporter periplasmic adaptor subunit n=1 Tax=Allorhizobium sonneratiae TaxID=2934936 RepID=UPI0020345CCB|nr:efflux RND transporter periplasmic adaptor subunit [Allorhizobium sonneratiae]MCM2291931.1 efflux RND transporter periplasmic adaptor subunit [Allorhizobium sonneratiae]
MKKVLTGICLVALAAAGAWHYRANIPLLKQWAAPASGTATADAAAGHGAGDGKKQGSSRHGAGGPVPVKTVAATVYALPIDAPATGWAEAEDTTTISALEAGLITKVVAEDGQDVKTGDVIAQMDDRVAQATVDKDRSNIDGARANLAEYEAALTRAASLLKQNAQSQQTYEQAKASRDSAVATLEADKATLASDQVTLEHMKIVAPFDGRLGDIQISPGAYMSAGSAVVTITRYNPIYVKFQMPERYLPMLHKALTGTPVKVSVDPQNTGGIPVEGKLTFFDNSVDTTSGTILVKGEFQNPKGALWPGQSVNVTVHFTTDQQSVVVPTVAVRPGADGSFVYTVDAHGKAHAQPVQVIRSNGDMTALADGVKNGDHVVIEGMAQLADGQSVQEEFKGTKTAGDPTKFADNDRKD